jgi:hypothetical protein
MQSVIKQLNDFVKFAAKEISLSTLPKIHFVGNKENTKAAFGHSKGDEIYVRITERHPGDIMRTIAHELIHVKQTQMGKKGEQFREDEANAIAGRIMRKFNTTYPSVFNQKATPPNLKETESLIPANVMGSGGPGAGIQTYSPLIDFDRGNKKFNPMSALHQKKKLRDIVGLKAAFKRERRAETRKDQN